jgi:hypothetical protein
MNIYEICNFLNFYVQKERGLYFSFPELTEAIDRAQMALYADLYSQYATSQRSQDALAPFLANYDFTPTTTLSGYIAIPSDSGYINLLDITAVATVDGRTVYIPIPIVNKDERAIRLNSQVSPVTVTNPIAEMTAPRYFRLWPATGLTGFVSYFRRPTKPVLSYTLISGRVPYYNAADSTQLEWGENFIDDVMIKALETLGINMGDDKTLAFSNAKAEANFANMNHS